MSAVAAGIFAAYSRRLIAPAFLPFLTSEWFNLGDPLFHRDVGYYVFQRPFYLAVLSSVQAFIIFSAFFTASAYMLLYGRFDFYNMKRLLRSKAIVCHQIINVVLFLLIKAASYRFKAESILFAPNKEFVGGSYIDISVWARFYQLLPILLIFIAVLTVIFALNSKYIHAVFTALLYPLSLVMVVLVAQVMQMLIVDPNEVAVENVYMQNNIDFTRTAYGLDKAIDLSFNIQHNLNGNDILDNLGTINNIPLFENKHILSAANQTQAGRTHYQFSDADIAPYNIDGRLTAVAISAREVVTDRLEGAAKGYVSTKMKYTHANGIVACPVNSVTEQGQPYFIIRDIPPRAQEGAPEVLVPRIYYGEHMKEYVIVGTKDNEQDDISASGYSYKGSGGVPLTLPNRLLFALKYNDFRLITSNQITKESRLLTNRNVLTRVKKAAPFLTFDNNPYLIIDSVGRLKWIADGYTVSQWFPYSQYSDGINYIKNSVKAVVDAYNGDVDFYITDEADPIIRSYRRIYPMLFSQYPFPEDLANHLRYPEGMFKMQAELLKKYHITTAAELREKDQIWAIPLEKHHEDKDVNVEPYYGIIKMPDTKAEEFALIQPYAQSSKTHLVSMLTAVCGGNNYGRLAILNLSGESKENGPYQIENLIHNDAAISKELMQLTQSDFAVSRGRLMAVPIKNSILYVEPIYAVSNKNTGQLPELKKVIIAYGDRIVAKPTLDEGLRAIFGVNRPAVVISNEETLKEIIEKVVDGFEEMAELSRQGDWENSGRALKRLEGDIQALKEKSLDDENLFLTED